MTAHSSWHPQLRSFRLTLILTAIIAAGVFSFRDCSADEPIEFKGHKEVVYDGKFFPDGKSLVTASFDQTLKLWEYLQVFYLKISARKQYFYEKIIILENR